MLKVSPHSPNSIDFLFALMAAVVSLLVLMGRIYDPYQFCTTDPPLWICITELVKVL